jgi:ADP-ribose pyrophosphatase YjhB (NUDIX family)
MNSIHKVPIYLDETVDEFFAKELARSILNSGITEITVRVAVSPMPFHRYSQNSPEILLIRRQRPHSEAKTYELPGGKWKYGSILDNIYRESQTETGLKISRIDAYLGRIDVEKKDKRIAVLYFAAHLGLKKNIETNSIPIRLNYGEHDNYIWVTDNTLSNYLLSSETKSFLKSGFKLNDLKDQLFCPNCNAPFRAKEYSCNAPLFASEESIFCR